MTAYIIVGAVVSFLLGWAWYAYLFPKVQEEFGGKPGGRQLVTFAIAFLLFAGALGTFLKNRHVLDVTDALRVGFKVWLGFVLPVAAGWWAATRKTLTAFVANAGFWLLNCLVLALIAVWILL